LPQQYGYQPQGAGPTQPGQVPQPKVSNITNNITNNEVQ
jgi:hypothetical protein